MEKKHINLRDVGLALRHLSGNNTSDEPLLPCGRLLRCGAIESCSFNELRRPRTIVNLRMGEDAADDSLMANAVLMLQVPAENRLEKYDTSDTKVRAWLQSVIAVFSREDVSFPVLLHCRSGKDRTGVVTAALLLLMGFPENLVVREFLLSETTDERNIRLALVGFRGAGGIDAYLSHGGVVDVETVRARILGHASAEERVAEEIRWLQQEVPLMCNLARNATQALDEDEAKFWSSAVVEACGELAGRLPSGEAAAALYCMGWALGQLRRDDEACEVLSVGIALANQGGAKTQVVKKLQKELGAHGEEMCVLDIKQASDSPGDPHVDLILLAPAGQGAYKRRKSLRCPPAFSWLRCGELAVSAIPQSRHLDALEALGLFTLVSADIHEGVDVVLSQIAESLSKGIGCLIHCADGFGASGVVAACFLVCHGLDRPVKAGNAGQPQMSAGEAIEVLRLWRPGSLVSVEEEEQVHQFAHDAWAKHVEGAQRAFSGASKSPAVAKAAPSNAKVVAQPGDGNCLFHSLAFALGGSALSLRGQICAFMEQQPNLTIAGTTLAEWIQMLAGVDVVKYAKKMSKAGNWGGAPEIAACAHMRQVNIHVYEKKGGRYELSVQFDVGGSRTITVLYVGGVHYDALVFP